MISLLVSVDCVNVFSQAQPHVSWVKSTMVHYLKAGTMKVSTAGVFQTVDPKGKEK